MATVKFFFIHSSQLFISQTVDGMILEKPVDKHDAYRMLSRSVSVGNIQS